MLTSTQKHELRMATAQYIKIAEDHYNRKFRMPAVQFDLKGSTAGTANPRDWVIKYQPVLAANHFDNFIADTVPHEVAHLIDFEVNNKLDQPRRLVRTRNGSYRREKRSLHGESWKRVMRVFGIRDISRCHSYDTTEVKHKKTQHKYVCNECGTTMTIGPKRHMKMQRNPGTYWMKACAGHKAAGYTLQSVIPPQRMAAQAKAPKPKNVPPFVVKPTPPFQPKSGTKIERAIAIVHHNQHQDRNYVITKIMNELNMSFAGAQTYYYKAKKMC